MFLTKCPVCLKERLVKQKGCLGRMCRRCSDKEKSNLPEHKARMSILGKKRGLWK